MARDSDWADGEAPHYPRALFSDRGRHTRVGGEVNLGGVASAEAHLNFLPVIVHKLLWRRNKSNVLLHVY